MAEHRLRDGSTTRDRRLDRLVYFDERSRNFPIRALVGSAMPTEKRLWRLHPRRKLNQAKLGGCVGYSLCTEANSQPQPHRLDDAYAREVYFRCQREDPWPGGEYPGASPVYAGTSVLAGAKVMRALGFFGEYRWAFTIDEVCAAIVHEGPVVLGLPWYRGMFRPDEHYEIRPTGAFAGGHAIAGDGFYPARARVYMPGGRWHRFPYRVARLPNTWGLDWGMAGDCFISIDALEALLDEWGECVVPVGRVNVDPVPAVT